MTEEEKNNATAYVKLHEDVRQLILGTVMEEIRSDPWGAFTSQLRQIAVEVTRNESRTIMDREIQNYRIVYKGNTAGY